MTHNEFRRWLISKGVVFGGQVGSHVKVQLGGMRSIFPDHGAKEIPSHLVAKIKRQLGLKDKGGK